MEKTFVIIDGNSLINRAYFAMQRPMITREGIYTQGIYGFLNMLSKINDDYKPGYIAVAFDLKAPTFRHLEYKDYKAGRKAMPIELAMEMPFLKDILHAMNIKTLELEGFEADDIIGTLSRLGEEEDLRPLIITGDKDALQLASDTTNVLITKKGITDFDIYDTKAMQERYNMTPLQFIDLKGIMGDSSDNIPGIPGIGEKGGIELITQFGSIENMLEHVDEIKKPAMKKKVEENAQLALMSKKLATINRFVPVDFMPDEFKVTEPDYEALISLYRKLEFNSFIKKLSAKLSGGIGETLQADNSQRVKSSDSADSVRDFADSNSECSGFSKENNVSSDTSRITIENIDIIDISDSIIIDTENDLSKLCELKDSIVYVKVFGDNNHIEKPEIEGVFIMSTKKAFYIDLSSVYIKLVTDLLNSLSLKFAGHDLINDIYQLMYYGLKNFVPYFDTAVAQYVLDVSRSKYDLETLSLEYLGPEMAIRQNNQMDMFSDVNKVNMQNGISCGSSVFYIADRQRHLIKEKNLSQVFYEVEMPLIEVMAAMEVSGMYVDADYLEEFGKVLKQEISGLEDEIHELAGEKFNIKSTQKLGEILFTKLGLKSGKKTKTGYSTGQEVLEKIKDEHPIVPKILKYRNLTKLDSTYVEGLKPLIGSDKRIRAHFRQTVTQTGRISCTEPNLQNIPVRSELGRKLRKAFVAPEGYTLVGADYSQIELRVLAHLSQDETLIDAFNNGEDIHKMTAARVLGIDPEKVTPNDRSRAKAVNFGVIYGMSAFGLSDELSISRKEAESYIDEYFKKHVRVKEYLDSQVKSVKENGFSTTILGRVRNIPEISASNYMVRTLGERLAMNSPVQGSAADIIKIAMNKVYKELKEKYPESKLVLQVHDELIIQAKDGELSEVKELLVRNMEGAVNLSVKLIAEPNSAKSWYDLK